MERRIDLQFGFGDVITKLKSSCVRKPLDSLIPLYQCSLSLSLSEAKAQQQQQQKTNSKFTPFPIVTKHCAKTLNNFISITKQSKKYCDRHIFLYCQKVEFVFTILNPLERFTESSVLNNRFPPHVCNGIEKSCILLHIIYNNKHICSAAHQGKL